MKICPKCGAHQNDERTVCLDCGAVLGKALSEKERKRLEDEMSEAMQDKLNKTELSHVGPLGTFLGIFDVLGIIATFILMKLFSDRPNIAISFVSIVFFAGGFVITIFPMLGWTMDKLRLSLRYGIDTDGMEPPYSRVIVQRICRILLPALGVFFCLNGILG